MFVKKRKFYWNFNNFNFLKVEYFKKKIFAFLKRNKNKNNLILEKEKKKEKNILI